MAAQSTVTNGNWAVSTITGSNTAGAELSVRVHYEPGRSAARRYLLRRGDHDGRAFASSEEAHAFALAHGYAQPHVTRQWCPACRVLHVRKRFEGGVRGDSWCAVRGTFVSRLESEIPTALPVG